MWGRQRVYTTHLSELIAIVMKALLSLEVPTACMVLLINWTIDFHQKMDFFGKIRGIFYAHSALVLPSKGGAEWNIDSRRADISAAHVAKVQAWIASLKEHIANPSRKSRSQLQHNFRHI